MVYGFFAETRSRRQITGLFGTYVPKEIVAEMTKNPGEYSMRGESREMTGLFSDVRDFTSISKTLTPEDLKDLTNTYLTEMTLSIRKRRGTVDKYIGDAIMAFWGAPVADDEHVQHALECSLHMQVALRALDPVFVEGVAIFEPLGQQGEVGEREVKEIDRFHKALEHYRKQRWEEAEGLLKSLAKASPGTKLYQLYLERIAYFRTTPPATDWDGVFVFTTK